MAAPGCSSADFEQVAGSPEALIAVPSQTGPPILHWLGRNTHRPVLHWFGSRAPTLAWGLDLKCFGRGERLARAPGGPSAPHIGRPCRQSCFCCHSCGPVAASIRQHVGHVAEPVGDCYARLIKAFNCLLVVLLNSSPKQAGLAPSLAPWRAYEGRGLCTDFQDFQDF